MNPAGVHPRNLESIIDSHIAQQSLPGAGIALEAGMLPVKTVGSTQCGTSTIPLPKKRQKLGNCIPAKPGIDLMSLNRPVVMCSASQQARDEFHSERVILLHGGLKRLAIQGAYASEYQITQFLAETH